ncbi:ABC transporter permease [Achromobacter veterisilvae]|jgi:NitT/TauT family transport system permease protein/taurine transport system permease protein|uniref:ABC transporter permease n=1 Tax=Achromobacter veterisilvae TaxID=2069367 RepID=A0A446C8E1_9BURK|nr:ABC transporter permease [Achromobacter veterisilvae]SSW64168.1 Putative aliphatic sulfonates transport permease protein SsuC [Achromobacter veterisilvae]
MSEHIATLPARRPRASRRRVTVGVAAVAIAFAAWWAVSALGLVNGARFPTPATTWQAAVQLSRDSGYAGGTLFQHIGHSLRLVFLGFLVAISTGVPLGLLMGFSKRFDALIGPVFSLLRPIPPLAWIPLAILWLGLGDSAKIFLIWVSSFTPAVINTYAGVRNIDPTLIEAARVHGAGGPARMLREVLAPGSLPMIFTGLRLSLQTAWMTLVAAELIGAFIGLGKVLDTAALDIRPGMILYAMIWVGLLGAVMTRGLEWIEKRALPWLP